MHEFSLAESIFALARRATPAGATLRRVKVVAGPLRCIDREAMELAWSALTVSRHMPGIALDLRLTRWSLRCPKCGRGWESDELDECCPCGGICPAPVGCDELQVVSIEVDD